MCFGFFVLFSFFNEVIYLSKKKKTLVFCEANLNKILCLRYVFTWFEVISGIKVNLGQSWFRLVTILGYKMSELPLKYLGRPFGFKFKAKIIWNTILEIWKKDGWDGND